MKRLLAILFLLPLTVSTSGAVVVGFHGSYGYYGELWYPLHVDSTMGLGREAVKGVDYDATVSIDQARFPDHSRISWRVPEQPPRLHGVYGYPHLSWGAYERDARKSPVSPARVNDIHTLSVTLELDQQGTPDGASVLNEFYLLADPTDPGSKIAEIGVFVTSTQSSVTLMTNSEQLGRLRDPSGREWIVAATDSEVPFIMFRPSDAAAVSGTLDWAFMLRFLLQQERISGEEWFTGMAIGPEPRTGEGVVTVSVFDVRYRQG